MGRIYTGSQRLSDMKESGPFFVMKVFNHGRDEVVAEYEDLVEACKRAEKESNANRNQLRYGGGDLYCVIQVFCGSSIHREALPSIIWSFGDYCWWNIAHGVPLSDHELMAV